jgi:hypothetical protein
LGTLVARLGFGSIIGAILVGAFNKVVAQEKQEAEDEDGDENDDHLPDGYRVVGTDDFAAPMTLAKARFLLNYMITSNVRGSIKGVTGTRGGPGSAVMLSWALSRIRMEKKRRLSEVRKASGATAGSSSAVLVLLDEVELSERLDAEAASGLLLAYGVAPDSMSDEEVAAQLVQITYISDEEQAHSQATRETRREAAKKEMEHGLVEA